jgi:drug/metabolite transporter (DMT)-like permease
MLTMTEVTTFMQEVPQKQRSELREALMLSIPTVFDLIATVLMNIGLLSVTASVYQMMRGAEMVFAAVLAVLFLHRHLNALHFAGIAACIAGISLVGLSSVLAGEGGTAVKVSPAQVAFGMALIVASQMVQAAQVTFEDYFMSEMSISPMKIVGYEGVVGSFLMLGVLSPIVRMLPGVLSIT